MKYILVTGGVISGIGKGVIASSTGLLLKTLGLKVTSIKVDPYLNCDAGTLSPLDHGEVFVLDDGGEVDLDLGNYERFLDVTLTRDNNITTGKIYRDVIERERKGDYLGKTVQVVPHITDAIQEWIERVSKIPVDDSGETPDVCVIELGGTIGDIESAPFVEAMRQFQFRVGHDNFCLIHVSLVPVVGAVNEQKTKPTQMSIRDLRGLGLSPDIIACRSTHPLSDSVKSKISMFCHVPAENVLAVHDCSSVYHVPLLLVHQNLVNILQKRLNLNPLYAKASDSPLYQRWSTLTKKFERLYESVKIALVGKYTDLQDSYCSVVKALQHAALGCNRKLQIEWVEASDLEPSMKNSDPLKYHESWKRLCSSSGILVPGGFGGRGTEGKILAAKWAREHAIPYLGICLGMQLAVVEFARNVCNLQNANSSELDPNTPHPVVIFMPEGSKTHLGGTMRLGARETHFVASGRDSVVKLLYGNDRISERHRHRYEVNPEYVKQFEAKGLMFVGQDDTHQRMEIVELKDHPFFIGVQYHPEYQTRPLRPSAPFVGFILAASGLLDSVVAELKAGKSLSTVLGWENVYDEKSGQSTPMTETASANALIPPGVLLKDASKDDVEGKLSELKVAKD